MSDFPGIVFLGSVLTHYFIYFAFVVMSPYPEYYAIDMVVIWFGILVSLNYHVCQLLIEENQCLFFLTRCQFMDHITAEATMIVVAVNFLKIPQQKVWLKWMLIIILVFTLLAYKMFTDTPYFTGAVTIVCFLYGTLTQVYRPVELCAGLSCFFVGMSLYLIETFVIKQYIVHSLWHVFIYASIPLMLRATWNTRHSHEMMSVVEAIAFVYRQKNNKINSLG